MGPSSGLGRAGVRAQPCLAVVARDGATRRRIAAQLGDGFRVTATGPTPPSVRELCGDDQPDVVVMKLDSMGREPIRAIRSVHDSLPNARIVVIASPGREHDIRRALHAGADGLVLDSELRRTLGPTVAAVLAGQLSLPRALRHLVEKRALSYREKQVLALALSGATSRQVADSLFLAETTVKTHLARAFRKLGVRSRAEAAAVVLDPEAEPGQRLPVSVWPADAGRFARGEPGAAVGRLTLVPPPSAEGTRTEG
jgi:DNA-binding NarL/FixJ family response regulator